MPRVKVYKVLSEREFERWLASRPLVWRDRVYFPRWRFDR